MADSNRSQDRTTKTDADQLRNDANAARAAGDTVRAEQLEQQIRDGETK